MMFDCILKYKYLAVSGWSNMSNNGTKTRLMSLRCTMCVNHWLVTVFVVLVSSFKLSNNTNIDLEKTIGYAIILFHILNIFWILFPHYTRKHFFHYIDACEILTFPSERNIGILSREINTHYMHIVPVQLFVSCRVSCVNNNLHETHGIE
jgi:hypothetical protein